MVFSLMLTPASCAHNKLTSLEQQQISIEDPMLFEKSDAFTIAFATRCNKDYSFPLPVGKATTGKDYNVVIENKKGDVVKSMFDGVVRLSKNNSPFGNVIVVRHSNGIETFYDNNAENLVKSGDRVKAGQTIAIVGTNKGSTYCEFAMIVNSDIVNVSIVHCVDRLKAISSTYCL